MRIFSLLIVLFLLLRSNGQMRTLDIHNNLGHNPNETTVAIHPSHAGMIVAASNINNIYYSSDTGNTWSQGTATSDLGVYGDPVMHYSGDQLWYAHLSRTPGKAYGEWFDRIVVQRIHNLETWEETSYGVGFNNNKTQDKPWISSDNTDSKFKGNIYLTWTEFDKYKSADPDHRSRIRFSKFRPSYDSFSTAVTISDTTGDCMDDDNTLEGATTAVGKYGEIYAVWSGHNQLWFDKSMDGGISWGEDMVLASHVNGWNMDMPYIYRANGMPFIATDNKRGMIYICWADEFLGNGDIWLVYSSNQGRSWSNRIKMNLDEGKAHQYFPNICINEESGDLLVAYYDQRHSGTAMYYDIYVSTFNPHSGVKEHRISAGSIPLPGNAIFFGDYLDIDHAMGITALSYTIYEGLNSDIRMSIVRNNDWTLEMKPTNTVAVVENSDSLFCSLLLTEPSKIRLKYTLEHPDSGVIRRKLKATYAYSHEFVAAGEMLFPGYNRFKLKIKMKGMRSGTKESWKFRKMIKR